MNFTKNLANVQNIKETVLKIFDKYPALKEILNKISKSKGQAYLVGGAVRDIILNQPITDIDIEVHYLDLETLSNILADFGQVDYVGKSFGILKLHKMPIDWSLPRTDKAGRKPIVEINYNIGIEEALRRRDLTINAMAINLHDFSIVDPFDGLKDLENKTLRSPDPHFFVQDPLRFYRVMQFISRLQMKPDKTLDKVCSEMDVSDVSIERIESEFEKLLLKSKKPSLGIRWLEKIGKLKKILPELYKTIDTKQNPVWHPEVFVFEHTMQSIDAAAGLNYKNNQEKLIIMYAALCHDLGKATTSIVVDGVIKSPGHDEAGFSLTKSMLKRISKNKENIETAAILVRYHMAPLQFVQLNAKDGAYKRLALKLKDKANLCMLAKLALADRRGRNDNNSEPLDTDFADITMFIERAESAGVLHDFEAPILQGRDIQDLVEPGKLMGELLQYAYDKQLNENIKDKKTLRELIVKKLQKS